MRAADLAKGKDPSRKALKNDRQAPNTLDERLEQKREALRLRDLEGIGYPEADRQNKIHNGKTDASEAAEKSRFPRWGDGATPAEAYPDDSAPKGERLEPGFRLSDMDLEITDLLKGSAAPSPAAGVDIGPSAPVAAAESLGIALGTADAVRDNREMILEEKNEPPPPPSREAFSDSPESNEGGVRDVYLRALAYLANARSNIEANRPIEVQPAAAVIKDMISLQYDMDAEFYQITVEFGNETDYVYSHSVNTAIYCLKVGQRLGYPPKALLELGLAALLCDVGMFRIPEEIVNKKGKLSASEIDAVKSHPKLGEEVLLPFKKDFPAAVEAVLQHQERENGQGYPRGLKGDEISEYAKIIGICDSYEAMTHNRPHKKALMQTESIRELIGSKNQLFSPKVIKAFLDEISIFPIGSYVRLNNRNIGCVIATNRMNPLKPTIRLLFDENGRRFIDPKVIDLKAHPILNIEGSVSRDELPA